ncbi:MAG: phospho-sugar mutase, partial [Tumebacillaceae bacterium]
MNAQTEYEHWLHHPLIDEETKRELQAIAGDQAEIEERFYRHLAFGTAGLRGVIGAGTNRINAYTVRRVTQGLANAIAELGEEAMRRGVVIAYDSRHLSPELAFATAATLVANGIDAYLFTSLRPTPELSFAVRELGTIAGIVLTASHNPPEYNGYKVYWEDGAQITPERAKQLSEHILAVQDFAEIKSLPQDEVERSERLHRIDRDVDDAYMARLKELVLNPEVIRT